MKFMTHFRQEQRFMASVIVMMLFMPQGVFSQVHGGFLESVDNIVEPYVKANWFTGTVALYHSDRVIYQRSDGYADIDAGQPIAAENLAPLHVAGEKAEVGSVARSGSQRSTLRTTSVELSPGKALRRATSS